MFNPHNFISECRLVLGNDFIFPIKYFFSFHIKLFKKKKKNRTHFPYFILCPLDIKSASTIYFFFQKF